MSNDIFDFGFCLVDESELDAVQHAEQVANENSSTSSELQTRLDDLYNAFTPLLNNLKANPEKEYILWKDRVTKVEQFEDHIRKIYQG